MASFKNEKGLTLIELLITISVLAVVSAIALPVINNVVTSSNSNAYNQTLKDAQAFIDKYSKGGVVVYDGLRTLAGYVDKDGDNKIEADEKIDTLTLDSKYAMSVTGSASEGGSYTNGGVTAATITVAGSSSTPASSALTFNPGDFDTAMTVYGFAGGSANGYVSFNPASTAATLLGELEKGTSVWTIKWVNNGQTLTYLANRGSAGYWSPDWSSLGSATPSAQTVVPNFQYSVTQVTIDAAAQIMTLNVQ